LALFFFVRRFAVLCLLLHPFAEKNLSSKQWFITLLHWDTVQLTKMGMAAAVFVQPRKPLGVNGDRLVGIGMLEGLYVISMQILFLSVICMMEATELFKLPQAPSPGLPTCGSETFLFSKARDFHNQQSNPK